MPSLVIAHICCRFQTISFESFFMQGKPLCILWDFVLFGERTLGNITMTAVDIASAFADWKGSIGKIIQFVREYLLLTLPKVLTFFLNAAPVMRLLGLKMVVGIDDDKTWGYGQLLPSENTHTLVHC